MSNLVKPGRITPTLDPDNIYQLDHEFHVWPLTVTNDGTISFTIGGYDIETLMNRFYKSNGWHTQQVTNFSPNSNMNITCWLSNDYYGIDVNLDTTEYSRFNILWSGFTFTINPSNPSYIFKSGLYKLKPGTYYMQVQNTTGTDNIYYSGLIQ